MKKLLVLAGMLLCLAAPMTAFAQGAHLNWGGCGPAGTADNAFACASNATIHQLVSSFSSPPGITNFVASTTEILVAGAAPLGPWWALQSGGCRSGALSSEDPAALQLGDCSFATFDGSQNLGLANYTPNYLGNPNHGYIITDMARSDAGVPLNAGEEYQANVIQIRSTKTVGTACPGCNDQVSLRTVRVLVGQPSGAIELDGNGGGCVAWRGSTGCTVSNRRQSWGEVKSLYR